MDAAGGTVSNTKAKGIFQARLEEALIQGKELMPAISELEARLQSKQKPKDMLPAPFPPSVDVYHELSLKRTILEVQAMDRIGLLYQLARLVTKNGYDISFARIATERGVAMDTFYIESIDPKAEMDTNNLLELREQIETLVRG